MARARIVPLGGPVGVQTSTPASAERGPPSQTSADRTIAMQSRGGIVFDAIEFMRTFLMLPEPVSLEAGSTSRSSGELFVLGRNGRCAHGRQQARRGLFGEL